LQRCATSAKTLHIRRNIFLNGNSTKTGKTFLLKLRFTNYDLRIA
jgi:hypothetical protein